MTVPREARRRWIEPEHPALSVVRQCALAEVPRSTYYHPSGATESTENRRLMRRIDERYLERPFYGVPRMTAWLRAEGKRSTTNGWGV